MASRSISRYLSVLLLACAATLSTSSAQTAKEDKQQRKQDAVNQAHAADIDAAKVAATGWLKLVDDEKYAESWKQTAPFLKTHVTQSEWEKRLNATRKPIDPLVDRSLSTTEYRDQLPGLPAGAYVALVWESYFGTKRQMLESVILSLDDGMWKPVGYAVQ